MLFGFGIHLDFELSNHQLTNNSCVLLIIDLIISTFFRKFLDILLIKGWSLSEKVLNAYYFYLFVGLAKIFQQQGLSGRAG